MKNKLIVLIFMFVDVIFSISANEITTQGKRVAILPFTAKGNFDALYAEVAQDNFTTELIKGDMYKVVERSQLDKAMKELKFQSGSDFDESSAVEVGKLAGAEIVVIGIITALNNQIIINIRGINVKTGIAEFAEKDSTKTQEGLLTSVERIAKKLSLSGIQAPSGSQNSAKKTSNVDFSISEEYGNIPLSNSQKKFLVKFFQEKWGIDPRDTQNVHDAYKKYAGAGLALAITGGAISFVGFTMIMCGFISLFNSSTIDPYSSLSVGVIGIFILLLIGAPILAMSSWPLTIADKTKSIYTAFTGQKSFKPRISTNGGYNGKNKQFEIALGYSF